MKKTRNNFESAKKSYERTSIKEAIENKCKRRSLYRELCL